MVAQLLSFVQLLATPWTAVHQASPSFTIPQSLLTLMSIVSMMPLHHLTLSPPSFPASGSFSLPERDPAVAAAAKSRQSCPSLCDPIDGSPPGSRSWDSPGKNTGVGCHFLLQCMKVKSESEVTQSYPTLHDPMDCSLPGSSVHGIFQARVLEWSAIAFSEQDPKLPQIQATLIISQCLWLKPWTNTN